MSSSGNLGGGPPDGARMRAVYLALESLYPGVRSALLEPSRGSPTDVLIATILSQATNDTLSGRAFRNLKSRFPTWESVLRADPQEVEEALAVGGLQREKTKKIRATLAKIIDDFGAVTLEPLLDWPLDEVYAYLVALPGVGPKTAACVIGFGLERPAFPVDTHVLRLSRRLGLVPEKCGAEKAQRVLEAATPPSIKMPLHMMMIQHGRNVCSARKPRCRECPLRDACVAATP